MKENQYYIELTSQDLKWYCNIDLKEFEFMTYAIRYEGLKYFVFFDICLN